MRIGVFGGTFNPIHLGHLLVADDIRRRRALNRVLFIPAGTPPHKSTDIAPYLHRSSMVQLALKEDWPGLRYYPLERDRQGPSYTVDTLRELRAKHRRATLYLMVGADQYRDIASWRNPEVLPRLARILVMDRPGIKRPPLFPGHSPRLVQFVPVVPVSISAAQLRARLAKGESVRYMLPTVVSDYIEMHRLYQS